MRVTQPLLGIKRIFPLIKEHAPDCITVLPSFAALPRGTRLAIDATLWIQRLHFATDQHPDRHVFGFHRLIKQLRQHDLIPIMVFDNFGQQARLPAKTREHQRRRSQRCMLTLRAKIEEQRARRLYVLQSIVEHYKRLEPEERGKISRLLSGWREDETAKHDQQRLGAVSYEGEFAWKEIASEKDRGNTSIFEHTGESLEEQDRELDVLFSNIDSRVESAEKDGFHESMVWKDIEHSQLTQIPSSKGDEAQPGGMSGWDASLWSQVIQTESSEVLSLASRIRALRRQYALHVARANAGAAVSYGVMADWPKETQTQQQMTHSEGEVYRALEAGLSDPQLLSPASERIDLGEAEAARQGEEEIMREEEEEDLSESQDLAKDEESIRLEEEDADDTEQMPSDTSSTTMDPTLLDDIDTLAQRNAHMQQYYVRSSTTLSQSAYESCATLCEMLNVPVLWTGSGNKGQGRPHEAEALASMLVRHGYADVVVSEDSDVILYDVPLLRGVMGAKKLELVDSSRVRKTLFPPQAALERLQRDKQPKGDRHFADEMDISLDELREEEVEDLDPVLLDAEQSAQSDVTSTHEDSSSSDVVTEVDDRSQTDLSSDSQAPTEAEDAADRASRKQMLDFALLCGTDFNRTIPGIASSRAFRLIQEFGSIDGIRTEAVKRAVLDKRRAKRIAAASSVKRSARSVAGPASDPVGSSLISSLRNEAGLRTPDHLTWREYGKELTQARHVFEQPPTLFWQLRKVRDLKRDKQESLNAANLAMAKVDRAAVKTFMRKRGAKDEEWEDDDGSHQSKESHGRGAGGWARRSGSRKAANTAVEGFGAKPFNDGGPVATWP